MFKSTPRLDSNVCAGSSNSPSAVDEARRCKEPSVSRLPTGKNAARIPQHVYTASKKIIFDSRAGKFICLANQGYPERQRITHPISAEGWIGPRMTKKSTLIGCGVIWMTRSRGDGRGVLIKSHWRYDPNSACPVISPLTKNHYIRCQRGINILTGWGTLVPGSLTETCASTANLEQQEGWGQRFVQISTSIPAAKTGGITLRLLRQTVPARHH